MASSKETYKETPKETSKEASKKAEDLESQFNAIWKDALAEYAPEDEGSSSKADTKEKKSFGEQLGIPRKKKFALDDLSKAVTVKGLLAAIEQQNSEFDGFRKKRQKLFTVLEKALIPIELICHMTAGAASNESITPTMLTLQSWTNNSRAASAHGVSDNYDSICTLFGEIKDFTARLSIYTREKVPPELRTVTTSILVSVIKICALSSKLLNRGRVAHWLHAVFLEKDKAVAAEVKVLKNHVEVEQRLVGALTLDVTTRTAHRVDDSVLLLQDTGHTIQQFREEVREQFTAVTATLALSAEPKLAADEADAAYLDKIRTVLHPSSTPEDIYRGIASTRVPGTGDWIRTEPHFKAWLNLEKPILWVSGGPGAGKSYISSNIIQHLTELHPQGGDRSPKTSVAYFFCKDYDPELRSFNKALRTLSYAICQNDPAYSKHVSRICSFPDDLKTTRQIWQKLFIEYFQREGHNFRSRVYIVVDGLDEAPDEERRTFLELLQDFQDYSAKESKLRVQVILVGRPELNYVMDEILGEDVPMITVSASKNSEDIKEYVRTKVKKMPILRRASKALQAEITSTLTVKAEGMFLWVDLMLKEIANKRSELQIRKALSTAPRGLNDTIRVVLERFSKDLDEDGIDDLNALLSWVTCAQRPFRLDELEEIMKLRSPDGQGMIYLEGELRKRFASFFSVNREDGRSTEELQSEKSMSAWEEEMELPLNDDDTLVETSSDIDDDLAYDTSIVSDPDTTEVTLAHASIGEYFRDGVYKNETAVGFDAQESQIEITKRLLTIVCDLEPLVWEKWYNSSLGLYACDRWQEHLGLIDISKASRSDKIAIGTSLVKIFHNYQVTRRWIAQASTFEARWLYDEKIHNLIHEWLKDKDILSSLSGFDSQWVLSLDLESKNILGGAMIIAAEEWLKRYRWIACNLAYWLRAYVTAIECTKEGKPWPQQYPELGKESAERIKQIARFPGFEEDATWHNRVGQVLQETGYHEEAIEEFDAALQADPESWQAYAGLALVYGDRCSWTQAIRSGRQGIDILTSSPEKASNKDVYELLSKRLAQWETRLNQNGKALASYREIFASRPHDFTVVTQILSILATQKDYGEIMSLLRKMDDQINMSKGCSQLVEMCIASSSESELGVVSFCSGVTIAARKESGGLDVLRNMYITGIKISRKNAKGTTVLSLQTDLAMLYYNGYEDDAKATSMWEAVLYGSRYARPGTYLHQVRAQAMMSLCKTYVGVALRDGVGSEAFATSVEKLETLSKPFRGNDALDFDWRRDDVFNSTFNCLLSLGLLYRLCGREAEARACFVPHVKLGIELLTDGDPITDFQGFGKLAETFLHVGDDVNTLAAYSKFGLSDVYGEAEEEKTKEGGEEVADDDLVIVEREDAQSDAEEVGNKSVAIPPQRIAVLAEDGGGQAAHLPLSSSKPIGDSTYGSQESVSNFVLPSIDSLSLSELPQSSSQQRQQQVGDNQQERGSGADDAMKIASGASTPTTPSSPITATGTGTKEDDRPPHLLGRHSTNSSTTSTTSTSSSQLLPAPLPPHGLMECDGGCGGSYSRPDGLNLCRYCIDTALCDDCLAALRRGEMALRVCDANHAWLRVPEWGGGLIGEEMWFAGHKGGEGRELGSESEGERDTGKIGWKDWLASVRADWRL